MRIGIPTLISGLLLAAAVPAAAQQATMQADGDATRCDVCHGTHAHGNPAVAAPKLTGIQPWYLSRQLDAFRRGYRGTGADDAHGAEMRAIAMALDGPASMRAAVAYVGAFADVPAPVTVAGDAARGRDLYERCAGCHGAAAEGDSTKSAPALRGQNDWYLLKQLNDYRAGDRGTRADDIWGRQMRPVAVSLEDDAAVRDVVAYIASLNASGGGGASSASGGGSDPRDLTGVGKVTRYPLPNGSTFPIAQAVEVAAGTTLVFHSGTTPEPADPDAAPGSAAYWGDTEAQARSALSRLHGSLARLGLGFGDVVKMTVFLAGDPAHGGRMDFAGFMKAYSESFGTAAQPNKPARSAVQVAGLARPGMLVEIEVVAARP